jgi:hypothetical protein
MKSEMLKQVHDKIDNGSGVLGLGFSEQK